MTEIKNRYTGKVICTGECIRDAVCKNLADLGGADLRGANLGHADLGHADLSVADLGHANLRGADLGHADLGSADLGHADLGYADLRGADLRGARLAWGSHDLIAELLRREAKNDAGRLKIAGLILVCRCRCWDWFLRLDDPQTQWAIEVLSRYIVDGDDHPAELDQVIFNKDCI